MTNTATDTPGYKYDPSPFPTKAGEKRRYLKGIFRFKMKVRNADAQTRNIVLYADTGTPAEKLRGEYMSLQTLEFTPELEAELSKHWTSITLADGRTVPLGQVPADDEPHTVRPKVTVVLGVQPSATAERVRVIGAEVYKADYPDQFDTMINFRNYVEQHIKVNWYELHTEFSMRYAEWDMSQIEAYATARKPKETPVMEHNEVSELDKALPRTPDGKPADKWQDDNSLLGAFWGKLAKSHMNKYDWWRAAPDMQRRAWVHAALQVASLHDYPRSLDEAVAICATEIPKIASAKAAENHTTPIVDNPQPENANDTVLMGVKPANSNPIQEEPKVMQNHVESPVVVFPSRNGGTVYKGISFSVTMRVGGTFEQALKLMDEFARYPEYVAADCKVAARIVPQENAAPAVVQPNAATAPADPVPAAGDDVKVEKICQVIMHSKDTAEGKQITYDLMPMLGNGKIGTYRTVTLRNSHDLDKLTACGVNIADIKPELPYSVSIECGWKNGKEYQPGKFYRDLVYLKPITMAASA